MSSTCGCVSGRGGPSSRNEADPASASTSLAGKVKHNLGRRLSGVADDDGVVDVGVGDGAGELDDETPPPGWILSVSPSSMSSMQSRHVRRHIVLVPRVIWDPFMTVICKRG